MVIVHRRGSSGFWTGLKVFHKCYQGQLLFWCWACENCFNNVGINVKIIYILPLLCVPFWSDVCTFNSKVSSAKSTKKSQSVHLETLAYDFACCSWVIWVWTAQLLFSGTSAHYAYYPFETENSSFFFLCTLCVCVIPCCCFLFVCFVLFSFLWTRMRSTWSLDWNLIFFSFRILLRDFDIHGLLIQPWCDPLWLTGLKTPTN